MAAKKKAKAGATKKKKPKAVKKAKAVKKTARKAAKKATKKKAPARKAVAKKSVKAPAKAAAAKRKKAPAARKKQIVGEGDYAATRAFDRDQAAFVKKNKGRIAAMGKDAEAALDGPEGDALRAAEATAAGRSRDTF